jgi:NTE family protein/lysophospholipid hydrolase
VSDADGDPRPNTLELELFDPARLARPDRVHLVLLHPATVRTPRATARWLVDRPVELCHHVCLEEPAHFARLARFLVGKPFGLVLSGGAARALAHLGVVRAFEEAGIPIDIVAGTSAGALAGALLAMGNGPDEIASLVSRLFGGPKRRMLDFIPPRSALIGATRFNAVLNDMFGDVHFEDLWTQFLCTVTDLTAVTTRTYKRGKLRAAIRASCSLPMVMPPVHEGGHLLADGGLINNIPVDPLLEVTPVGFLAVVNVTNPFYTADEAYNYHDSISLMRVLRPWLDPRTERLVAPSIFDILMRSLETGSKSLEAAQLLKADLYVRPNVTGFGYLSVDRAVQLVDIGHRAAAEALEAQGVPSIPFAGP